MMKRDYHGWRLDEAVADVERLIGEVRVNRAIVSSEFITGHGAIQKALLKLFEQYDLLDAKISLTNSGVIKVTIE